MITHLKTTPLHNWHISSGGNMSDFGGFHMPLWYQTGVKTEHLSVLKSAGIFDTSHMGCISVNGKESLSLINYCFTRDIMSLQTGRCVYGAFLSKSGHCIDDAIVYKFSDDFFMICVNAGMGVVISNHLKANQSGFDAEINDLSGQIAKMDIQGPDSAKILSKLIQNPGSVFSQMPYFSFKGHCNESVLGPSEVKLLNNHPILLSRSGYTGEFGFEIFLNPSSIVQLWDDILLKGRDLGAVACGLAARDSLRAGACLPLSHQDIGNWLFKNHPWEFALPYREDGSGFTKSFIGDEALLSQTSCDYIYPFAGESLRKVIVGEQTKVLDKGGAIIGKVLTCVTDVGISWYKGQIVGIHSHGLPQDVSIKGLSCGFVMVSRKLNPEDTVTLEDGKRSIKATIVKDIRPDRTARKKISCFL